MRRTREYAFVTVAFSLLTIALTYPQILQMSTSVGEQYDALFSVWRLSWVAHQLPRDPMHLFDANIFYPATNTLAYSDALLVQSVIAGPFLWAGVNPVVVYNVLVLLSFVTAALAMYVCARGFALSPTFAFVGGVAFGFQQYRFAHFGHLELLWTCWIPLAFLALHHVIERRRVRDGALLGALVALQTWSCLYYGVFLVTALAVLAAVLVVRTSAAALRALVAPLLVGAIVAAVMCVPYALPYIKTQDVRANRLDESAIWSPTLDNYISTTKSSTFYKHPAGAPLGDEGALFPGVVTLVLAAAALRRRDRHALAYVALAIVAFDLSRGDNGLLFRPLRAVFFPYAGLRVPARLFVIMSAALAVLAARGAAATFARMAQRTQWMAVAGIAALMTMEAASVPVRLERVPERPPLYSWLREQPRAPVLEWPLPTLQTLGETRVPDYMYFSIAHWQPLVAGYSGGYPRDYASLLEEMRTFPSASAMQELRRRGVQYVILHSVPDPAGYANVAQQLTRRGDLQLLFVDRTSTEEVALYRFR